MHSIMMFFLTCGFPFFSDSSDEQQTLSLNQSNGYFAMAQVDEADFPKCPGCSMQYGRDVRGGCVNPKCRFYKKR